jgi:DHA1 family tetracycline resistance protein-like MFS transporter
VTPGRTIPFIVITIFIDAIGFGIIMPVLPQLVMEVGKLDLPHAIEIGAWIGLVMAVATFLASPVLGNLSDRFGRRRVLLLSLGGLATDYTLLAIVGTLPWLFVARAISGYSAAATPRHRRRSPT